MKMKKYQLIFLLVVVCFSSNAQTSITQKAWAFYTISLPGREQTDLDGKKIKPQPVIERFIYIETNYKNKPAIDSVFYNSVLFTATIDSIKEKKIKAGINAATGKPIVITPKKGNRLWMISLQQPNGIVVAHEQLKKILMKCRLGNTGIKLVITNETQLTAPDRY
jgi:hypothetical protein